MRVVGGHQRNARFLTQPQQRGHQALVEVESVVLDFEVEILLAEHILVLESKAAAGVVSGFEQRFVQIAPQAGRSAYQPLAMSGEQILVNAWFVVKAFEEGGRDQLDQVLVAGLILAQQQQVVIAIGVAARLVPLLRDVDFAADDRLDAPARGFLMKMNGAEQVAVVGNRHRRHLLPFDQIHQPRDLTSAVKQRIVGVAVQVDERGGHEKSVSVYGRRFWPVKQARRSSERSFPAPAAAVETT